MNTELLREDERRSLAANDPDLADIREWWAERLIEERERSKKAEETMLELGLEYLIDEAKWHNLAAEQAEADNEELRKHYKEMTNLAQENQTATGKEKDGRISAEAERDALKAQIAEDDEYAALRDKQVKELQAELAEARKDSERLEFWLASTTVVINGKSFIGMKHFASRAAIDAAMKKDVPPAHRPWGYTGEFRSKP